LSHDGVISDEPDSERKLGCTESLREKLVDPFNNAEGGGESDIAGNVVGVPGIGGNGVICSSSGSAGLLMGESCSLCGESNGEGGSGIRRGSALDGVAGDCGDSK
jgi:hypothetical protein